MYAWIKIEKAMNDTNTPLFIAACYFPPEQSTTPATIQAWNQLKQDTLDAATLGEVIVTGDFNARTGNLSAAETTVSTHEPLANIAPTPTNTSATIPPRTSVDEDINGRGELLLEFCRDASLVICNGRLPGDTPAAGTSKGRSTRSMLSAPTSVVDYFLTSPTLFARAVDLVVSAPVLHSLDSIAAFDHNMVSLRIKTSMNNISAATNNNVTNAATNTGATLTTTELEAHEYPGMLQPAFIPPTPKHMIISNEAYTTICEAMTQATNLQQFDDLNTAINAATTPEELAAAQQQVETLITSIAIESGATIKPTTTATTQQRASSNYYGRRGKRLARQRRRALRENNVDELRRLDNKLRCLAQKRKRKDSMETQLGRMLTNRMLSTDIWKVWNKPLNRETRVERAITLLEFTKHYQALFSPTHDTNEETPLPTYNGSPHADGSSLNTPFTNAEVQAALESLKPNKATAGTVTLGVVYPMMDTLVPIFTAMFNACKRLGSLPRDWAFCSITPIFKSGGNPTLCSDYRPIAVGTLPAKIYAKCLDTRLQNWAEANNIRAKGQAGFRSDYRGLDNVLLLNSIIQQQRQASQGLVCCFVDFKKAYDSVPRAKLWAKLERMGIDDWMIDAIKALYSEVPMSIKGTTTSSAAFTANIGLKQGCPLSPTLFGLYVDDIEPMILAHDSSTGAPIDLPKLRNTRIPPLLYADDLLLIATTAAGLQRQINLLESYAATSELTISVVKTKIVVFATSGNRINSAHRWSLAGQPIPIKDEFVYLGVEFNRRATQQKHGAIYKASSHRLNVAYKALANLRHRSSQLSVSFVPILNSLFDSLVRPNLEYGAELWSVLHLLPQQTSSCNSHPCQQLEDTYFRRLLGLRRSTPVAIVRAEFGRWPLYCRWAKLAVNYWNRLCCMEDDRLVKQAFLHGWEKVTSQQQQPAPDKNSTWPEVMAFFFQSNNITYMDSQQQPNTLTATWVEKVLRQQYLASTINGAPQEATKTRDYINNTTGATITMSDYNISEYIMKLRGEKLRTMARFRSGSHWLKLETGRHERLPREQRICECCNLNEVENEHHMLFSCTLYSTIRTSETHCGLFINDDDQPESTVRSFLNQAPHDVVKFIETCHDEREMFYNRQLYDVD